MYSMCAVDGVSIYDYIASFQDKIFIFIKPFRVCLLSTEENIYYLQA